MLPLGNNAPCEYSLHSSGDSLWTSYKCIIKCLLIRPQLSPPCPSLFSTSFLLTSALPLIFNQSTPPSPPFLFFHPSSFLVSSCCGSLPSLTLCPPPSLICLLSPSSLFLALFSCSLHAHPSVSWATHLIYIHIYIYIHINTKTYNYQYHMNTIICISKYHQLCSSLPL